MDKTWLTRQITVEEAETAHLVKTDRLGPKAIPFGFQNAAWEAFKATLQPGDELWEFNSPSHYWQNLAGRMGIALLRHGEIIDTVVTLMN